jgi:coiled-coil and C2 domain-containing protein 2A
LHALFTNDKISSIFKIDRPIFLSGYMTTRNEIYSEPTAQGQENFLNPFIPSYIMLTMTCTPRLALPPVNLTEYFPGFESTEFLDQRQRLPRRTAQATTATGRNTSRFGERTRGASRCSSLSILEPQRPPPDFEIDEDSYQKCARFVSLIPFTKDIGFFEDLPNMFTTSQEMIDLLAGDFEEHAVFLANYFNFIDRHLNKTQFESVLVLGQGVPEGNTIYVLRRDKVKDKSELWNPANAEVYSFDEIVLKNKFFCFNLSAGVTHEASCTPL